MNQRDTLVTKTTQTRGKSLEKFKKTLMYNPQVVWYIVGDISYIVLSDMIYLK